MGNIKSTFRNNEPIRLSNIDNNDFDDIDNGNPYILGDGTV
jgi:hypothetical protein